MPVCENVMKQPQAPTLRVTANVMASNADRPTHVCCIGDSHTASNVGASARIFLNGK